MTTEINRLEKLTMSQERFVIPFLTDFVIMISSLSTITFCDPVFGTE